MYFTNVLIIITGISVIVSASPYDDGMYHPEPTVTSYPTSYISSYNTTRSTYIGYWSSNSTTTTTALTKPMTTTTSTNTSYIMSEHTNMTSYTRPVNTTMTMTSARIYTTTVCDLQSSCHVTVATATGGSGSTRSTDMPQPTMTPFSSSDRLMASGWGALVLCGIALLL